MVKHHNRSAPAVDVPFTTDPHAKAVIQKIAQRAMEDLQKARHHDKFELVDVMMDVSATHVSNPLRLKDLFEADAFNFAHDILGIRKHLDRSTGKLSDMFSPRFSKRD